MTGVTSELKDKILFVYALAACFCLICSIHSQRWLLLLLAKLVWWFGMKRATYDAISWNEVAIIASI